MTENEDIVWQFKIDYARDLCRLWHSGQFDRAGRPYEEHPIEVANRVWDHVQDPAAVCVAFLHDLIEDTAMPVDLLLSFPDIVSYAVLALSRGKEESANAYMRRVLSNRLASVVKIHDIEHNFAAGRADAKILAKAGMYAGWHEDLCNALQMRRSFCMVHPAVESVCECPRHPAGSRLRRGERGGGVPRLAGKGIAVHPV